MTGTTWKFVRHAICVAALVTASAEGASAAPAHVASNTNLREGPGTTFGVITTAPAGSVVNVIRCGVEWCNVVFAGRPGYMIARNLGIGGPPRAAVAVVEPAPPVVVVGPGYYGPRYYYGPRRHWGWRRW